MLFSTWIRTNSEIPDVSSKIQNEICESRTKLIIGCGYLGQRVAAEWLAQGHSVSALTRSEEHADRFRSQGIEPIIGDVTDVDSLSQLPEAETVLYSVGFDRESGKSLREIYVAGLENVLKQIASRFGRLIFISSTSVYGQSEAEWVDENSPTKPARDNGRTCLEAERLVWKNSPQQLPSSSSTTNVLRLAGIYGPGRLLRRLDEVKSGEPIAGNPAAWLNLIHVEDAVGAILACEKRGQPGETYLVCDDKPITRLEYYQTLAELVSAEAPKFMDDDESQNLNKRCSNRKLHEELKVELRFPTLHEGLPNAIQNDSHIRGSQVVHVTKRIAEN
jgi:nucleoside-diphosphate-sugar epimerase